MSAAILYKAHILKLLGEKSFDQVCRICISGKGHLRDIHSTRIPKMMESCACIEVSDEDGLPSKICVACFHLITKFHSFKKKIECTDRILKQLLSDKQQQKSNIINKALNEAEINSNNEDELSEEDIPLKQRLVMRRAIERNYSSVIKKKEQTHIILEGPPPLIPLAPLKKVDTSNQPKLILPEDTPPLVPIKPPTGLPVINGNISLIKNVEYQCSTCDKIFPDLTVFKEHELNACQNNALQCSICKREFKEKKKLIGHLKGHMVTRDYACKICGLLYPNPSTVQIHIRTHTGERPFRCEICNKGFVRAAGLLGHMKIHQDVKPHKCVDCGKCFKIASNLRRHRKLHTGEVPFHCPTCKKKFSQWSNLQLHIRTYHTNDRPYLCSKCGKSFVNSTRLNRHMWIHSGYKPYVCLFCLKAYSNFSDLKNHERCHTGRNPEESKKYACNVCNKKFYQQCRLATHKKMHERMRACFLCNKKFRSEGLLRRHLVSKHAVSHAENLGLLDNKDNEVDVKKIVQTSNEIFNSREINEIIEIVD